MTDVDEIDGVGPSYAETLEEAGYDTAEAVAEAEPDELDDLISTTSGETLVSNANAEVDLDDSDDEAEESDEDGILFDYDLSDTQRNHLAHSLVKRELSARQNNRMQTAEMIEGMIDKVMFDEHPRFSIEELGEMYTAVNQYQSDLRSMGGIGGFVSNIRDLSNYVQKLRSDNLE